MYKNIYVIYTRTLKCTKRYVLITANARIFPHRILRSTSNNTAVQKKATPEFSTGSHLLVLFLFAKHFPRSKQSKTHAHIYTYVDIARLTKYLPSVHFVMPTIDNDSHGGSKTSSRMTSLEHSRLQVTLHSVQIYKACY